MVFRRALGLNTWGYTSPQPSARPLDRHKNLAEYIRLPKSIEELFGKRSNRRQGNCFDDGKALQKGELQRHGEAKGQFTTMELFLHFYLFR